MIQLLVRGAVVGGLYIGDCVWYKENRKSGQKAILG